MEERNIVAQESLAESARQGLSLARYQAYIAFAGAVAVSVGLYFAASAARAAAEANRLSVLDRRPWLSVEGLTVGVPRIATSPASGGKPVLVFPIEVAIRNSGRTPALSVGLRPRITHAFGTPDLRAQADEANAAPPLGEPGLGIAIAPGDTVRRKLEVDLPIGDGRGEFRPMLGVFVEYRSGARESGRHDTARRYLITSGMDRDGSYRPLYLAELERAIRPIHAYETGDSLMT